MKNLTRKERENILHRQEILEVAEKMFAQKGFYKTTMEEVAQRAEFAVGTIYKFFKSKEDLYSTVIEEKIKKAFTLSQKVVKEERDVIKKLEKIVSLHLQFFVDHQDFFKIYLSERSNFAWDIKGDLGDKIMKHYLRGINIVKKTVEEGIKAKKIKPLDARKVAFALDGLIHSQVVCWLDGETEKSLLLDVPFLMEIILKGIGENEYV